MPKAPDKKPPGYEQQGSRTAVHWLVPEHLEFVGYRAPKPTYVVSCGQPLDEAGHRSRTTKAIDDVSCWACVQIIRSQGLKPKVRK